MDSRLSDTLFGGFSLSDHFSYHLPMDDAQISLQTRLSNCSHGQLHWDVLKTRQNAAPALPLLLLLQCPVTCVWDLVPWSGAEPGPPALGARSLTHWTTREVPKEVFSEKIT